MARARGDRIPRRAARTRSARTRAPGPSTLALSALTLALGSCGARTGLYVPDVVRPADGSVQPIRPPPMPSCVPGRVHTRVGFTANLRPNGVALPTTGYTWSLLARPASSRAELTADGSDVALLAPDREGTYEALAEVTPAGGATLRCPLTVIADPPDPRCPGYALVEPTVVNLPAGVEQVALDAAWGPPRTTGDATRGAVLGDDTFARVSVLITEHALDPRTPADPATALAAEAVAHEDAVVRALGAVPFFVARTGTTHDGLPLRRSTLRISSRTVSDPGALRDRALAALAPGLAPPADPTPAQAPAAAFYVEVTTVLRPDARRVVAVVTVTPVAVADDPAQAAAIRVNDMANATALARAGTTLAVDCHEVVATRTLSADFLWLVDTSQSMVDDQQRVGETADQFFQQLTQAGVTFRVGVMEAGAAGINLEPPAPALPFRWISGADPGGALEMAYQVTIDRYHDDSADNVRPFRLDGRGEEPIAAAVNAVREFERRRATGSTNPDFVLRDGAVHVAFFVTDEPADQNDIGRFFGPMSAEWGRDPATLTARVTEFFTSRGILLFGLVPSFPGRTCPDYSRLAGCVITAAGGAFMPIDLSDTAEQNAAFAAAMTRVVDAVAGAASEFVLPRVPVSASLRARVDGRNAPRSRSDGFDYDDRTHALVFRGPTFRPMPGQDVRAAYFYWAP